MFAKKIKIDHDLPIQRSSTCTYTRKGCVLEFSFSFFKAIFQVLQSIPFFATYNNVFRSALKKVYLN